MPAGLRKNPAVNSVTVLCEPSRSSERPAIERFCDAELTTGAAVSWNLLLYSNGASWAVHRLVRRIDGDRSNELMELAEVVDDQAEVIERLRTMASELVGVPIPLE